jgi:hypothetical protein
MLLGSRRRQTTEAKQTCKALFVHGVRYVNSAAKFWPSLLDEVSEDHPRCSRIELSTLSPGLLNADMLYPEMELERDLLRMETENIAEVMRNTLALLEIVGPPASVRVRLFAGRKRILARTLPTDCVDAEIFAYLVAWLLRWACIREEVWNDEHIEGRFEAQDPLRGIRYEVALGLANRHISEGLYQRTVSLHPSVAILA